jgi:hypothetical protein
VDVITYRKKRRESKAKMARADYLNIDVGEEEEFHKELP